MSEQLSFLEFETPPLNVERVFLRWDKALVHEAVRYLCGQWTSGPLDLRDLLIIVPTRLSGRRLREALAKYAAQQNSAVIAPKVITPDVLCSADFLFDNDLTIATASDSLLGWIKVLLTSKIDTYPTLFPIPPTQQNFNWALNLANEFCSLQQLLSEAQLSFSDVALRVKNQDMEPERWAELAKLEFRWLKQLEKEKKCSPYEATKQVDENVKLNKKTKRIILLNTFDLSSLAKSILTHLSQTTPCTSLIYAPEDFASHFDEWGTPTNAWSEQNIPIPEPNERIHISNSPEEQSEQLVQLIREKNHSASCALGILDSEITRSARPLLNSNGIRNFDPSGKSYALSGLTNTLRNYQSFISSESLSDFLKLLQHPSQKAEHLSALEHFCQEHLCHNLDQLREFLKRPQLQDETLENVLYKADALLKIAKKPIDRVLLQLIDFFYPVETQSIHFQECFETLHKTLEKLKPSLEKHRFTTTEQLSLLLHQFSQEYYYEQADENALILQGWLELSWETAPHLILAGFNEHNVPERANHHTYAPNTLRNFLGLRTNETKHARDSYLMHTLLAKHEQVDFILGKVNIQRDPLKPSPFLLACKSSELPERVKQLFQKESKTKSPEAWSAGWHLTPPAPPEDARIFKQISVTQFRDYLSCPFRFYLKHVLGMEKPEANIQEMNARGFGNILHLVLENFGNSELKNSSDIKEINNYFQSELERLLNFYFGKEKSISLLVQRESIRQRLAWWAELEAQHRAEGWHISEVEKEIHKTPWELNGLQIRGKIDRIEINKGDGGIRLIDFKTGAPKSPLKAHSKSLRGDHDYPEWMVSTLKDKPILWTNLQLPLYHLAILRLFPNQNIQTAYANIGDTKEHVTFETFKELDVPLLESAQTCAEQIIESIKQKVFWPANPNPEFDDYAELLFGNPDKTIDPRNIVLES